jgi:putative transposase
MPRANRYYLPGNTYHLTHRCHDRRFLLRFAIDRDAYRRILWESKPRYSVWVLAYCLTSNHVHLLLRSEDDQSISRWMQRAEGEFAQWYNRRKGRSGAFWEGRYHCTLIDSPEHCERCMTYIELNMVRAGVVTHPQEWRWCSYQDWMGKRKRYLLVEVERALEFFGGHGLPLFREHYESRIREGIERGRLAREPWWTESVAVGNATFVQQVESLTSWRRRMELQEMDPGFWSLREDPAPWLAGDKRA